MKERLARSALPEDAPEEIACTTLEPLEESAQRSPVVARHLRSALAAAAADLDGSLAAALDPSSR
ncbi:MAG TPA: hypothetical protein VM779_16220 [Thermoanaerobaculia bacterium]|nr:hypothetical protein [Thermoanaerobaculia bacterium]